MGLSPDDVTTVKSLLQELEFLGPAELMDRIVADKIAGEDDLVVDTTVIWSVVSKEEDILALVHGQRLFESNDSHNALIWVAANKQRIEQLRCDNEQIEWLRHRLFQLGLWDLHLLAEKKLDNDGLSRHFRLLDKEKQESAERFAAMYPKPAKPAGCASVLLVFVAFAVAIAIALDMTIEMVTSVILPFLPPTLELPAQTFEDSAG